MVEYLETRCLPTAGFLQVDLASDLPGLGRTTVPSLVNPWGISFSPTGPFWVADTGAGVSNVLDGNADVIPLIAVIPAAHGGQPGSPTGTVFNGTSGFTISGNGSTGPSTFLFASEDGSISGWDEFVDPTHAVMAVNNSASGASYTGLAIAGVGGQTFLYAADFSQGKIEVFDSQFQPVSQPNAFQDPNLPTGLSPFNVQSVGNLLVVAYAKLDADGFDQDDGAGLGAVDIYTTSGTLVTRLASGGPLDAPWGVTLAPSTFGPFGGDLLIGNRGDGRISAFNPSTGQFVDQLDGGNGTPLSISGLWGITFGNDHMGGAADTLFFAAGLNNETSGLFGAVQSPDQSGADTGGAYGYDPSFPGEVKNYPVPPPIGPRLQSTDADSTVTSATLEPLSEGSLAVGSTLTFTSAPNTAVPPATASANAAEAPLAAVYFVSNTTPALPVASPSSAPARSDSSPIELNSFLNLDASSRTSATVERQPASPVLPAAVLHESESQTLRDDGSIPHDADDAAASLTCHGLDNWTKLIRDLALIAVVPFVSCYVHVRTREAALADDASNINTVTLSRKH